MSKPSKSHNHFFPIFGGGFLVLFILTILAYSFFLSCSLSRAPIVFARSSKDAEVTWSVTNNPFLAPPKAELHLVDIKSRSVSFDVPIQSFPVGTSWWWWWPTEYRFRAQLKDLKARHSYHYEILEGYGDGGKKVIFGSELFWMGGDNVFHEDPVVLGVISDNQLGLKPFQTILETLKAVNKDIHYLIHAGDAVQQYESSQWDTHFAGPLSYAYRGKEEEMSLSTEASQRDQCFLFSSPPPIIYAHGNHDEDVTDMYLQTTGPREGANYFAVTVGSARIIALDSWPPDMPMKNQFNWLKAESESISWQKASFRIAVFHQPAFIEHWDPHGWEQEGQKYWNKHVRTILLPELIKRGVNLIINGHQHAYSRGWLGGALLKVLTDSDSTMFQNSSETRANARVLGLHFRNVTRARMQEGSGSNSDRSSSSGSGGSSSGIGGASRSAGGSGSITRNSAAVGATANGHSSGKRKHDNTTIHGIKNGSEKGYGKNHPSRTSPGPHAASPSTGVSSSASPNTLATSPNTVATSPNPPSRGTAADISQGGLRRLVQKTSPSSLAASPNPRDPTSNPIKNSHEKVEPLPVPVYMTTPGHAMLVTIGGAGGDLDLHPVEDWGYVEVTIPNTHHFAVISLHNGIVDQLRWRTYDTKQTIIDAFDLMRGTHK